MAMSDAEIIKGLFNSFKPDSPLEPGDARYVDFQAVRGDDDIRTELGSRILNDDENTYQLYSGHRGGGKSTELLRLAKFLEDEGCVVVYFAAATDNSGDLSLQDTQYQDVLLSCTRQLLEKLSDRADSTPIQNWLSDRLKRLKELALTEVELEKMTLDVALPQFMKLTAAVRKEPNRREEIRKLVEVNTESLVTALNLFINNARKRGKANENKVVVIADNLDRIVRTQEPDKPSNFEEIFVHRSELMRSLDCHMVYTAPLSLLYSPLSSELQTIYGKPQILPMVMVTSVDGTVIQEEGIGLLRQALARRVRQVWPELGLVANGDEGTVGVFESQDILDLLCLSSGGHLRDLMHMSQDAINRTLKLPVRAQAVKRAITDFRQAYLRSLQESEWEFLLAVRESKQKQNDDDERYQALLAKRCILEYSFFDDDGERVTWYDVHPLIRGSKVFKERWAVYQQQRAQGDV